MRDLGEYRPIYARLVDDPDFQALAPDARLLLFVLKLSLGPIGIAVLPGARETLAERTGLRPDLLDAAEAQLSAAGWLRVERNVWWLVNGLKFETGYNVRDAKHRAFIARLAGGLPRLEIVDAFRDAYPDWLGGPNKSHQRASEGPSKTLGSTQTHPIPSTSQTHPIPNGIEERHQDTHTRKKLPGTQFDPDLERRKAEAKARLAEGGA